MLAEPTARIRTWAYESSGIRYRIRCYVADVTKTNWARDEILTRLTPDADLLAALTSATEALTVGGHTHQQMIRRIGDSGRTLPS